MNNSSKTTAFKTLGCKLNQTETAMMAEDFIGHGYQIVPWESGADVSVINTCTVTSRTVSKCRQAIRQAKRNNPRTIIIVTGCYSQVSADEVKAMPDVDYVLGVSEKLALNDLIPKLKTETQPMVQVEDVMHQTECLPHSPGEFGNQTRAFLKIQNGCDRRCAYCIVPFARGPSRSMTSRQVMKDFNLLVRKNYKEVVLTGVHVGDFKDGHTDFPRLLGKLAAMHPEVRIRLSSLDPENINDSLFEVIQAHPNICRHFHVALQSGSNTILKAMNRRHTVEDFEKIATQIQNTFPSFGLGTDIIVGFPGETDLLFKETENFVNQMPFTYFHVFPYSIRKGTIAATMPDQISAKIKSERAMTLRKIGQKKKKAFVKSFMGQQVSVLLENKDKNGWMGGLISEYLRVEVPYQRELSNQIVVVRIDKILSDRCRGKIQI